MFTGVKVFSATRPRERDELGENMNRWLKSNADLEVVETLVRQSSDLDFHCLSIIIFFRQRPSDSRL
jgi:hypothetical protein